MSGTTAAAQMSSPRPTTATRDSVNGREDVEGGLDPLTHMVGVLLDLEIKE